MTRRPIPYAEGMARLRWRSAIVFRSLGLAPLVAAVILAALLVGKLAWLSPAASDAAQRLYTATSGLEQMARRESVLPAPPTQPATPAGYATALGRMFGVVRDAGLQTSDVQYQIVRAKEGKGAPDGKVVDNAREHLVVTLPVTGTYPDVRRALGEMQAIPGTVIDTLTIERKSASDAQVVARIRLTLRGDGA